VSKWVCVDGKAGVVGVTTGGRVDLKEVGQLMKTMWSVELDQKVTEDGTTKAEANIVVCKGVGGGL